MVMITESFFDFFVKKTNPLLIAMEEAYAITKGKSPEFETAVIMSLKDVELTPEHIKEARAYIAKLKRRYLQRKKKSSLVPILLPFAISSLLFFVLSLVFIETSLLPEIVEQVIVFIIPTTTAIYIYFREKSSAKHYTEEAEKIITFQAFLDYLHAKVSEGCN